MNYAPDCFIAGTLVIRTPKMASDGLLGWSFMGIYLLNLLRGESRGGVLKKT